MSYRVKEEQILYDARGRKTHVLLPIKIYEQLLERLEDAYDVKAMREVDHEKALPWRLAKRHLRKKAK